MFKHPYVLLLAAGLASTPAVAQQADDAKASVPETRYTPAHVQRAPTPNATTPDRNWQQSNRTVAGQDAHAGHAGHATPAEKKEADPHAGHHDHMDHH